MYITCILHKHHSISHAYDKHGTIDSRSIIYYIILITVYLHDTVHAALTDLVMRCLPDIEQLPSQWEHSIVVPAHHSQPTDSQSLGRVTLSENESAVV